VQSSMLNGSETWLLVRKENEVALHQADMRMVRWMCDIMVKDGVPSKKMRETRIRLHVSQYYSKTGHDSMNMCCKKKIVTG